MSTRKTKLRIFISLLLASALLISGYFAYATETAETKQSAQRYDWLICVANYKNHCVNSACLNSSERHCSSHCLKAAVNKCKVVGSNLEDTRPY